MKLFWKMFFTIMFVSVTCLAFGGYILINSNFHTLLDREVRTAYDYGDIAYYSLMNELNSSSAVSNLPSTGDTETVIETVSRIAPSININSMNQKIPFGIMSEEGTVLYSSLLEELDKSIVSTLDSDKKGWVLKKKGNNVYMQAVRPALLSDNIFYIETTKDITSIFDSQKLQYKVLLKIMAVMFVAAGLAAFAISKLLMKRIVSLSKVTNDISIGNLSKRAAEYGNDEIAALSKNFNRMADDLEEIIRRLQEEGAKKELFVGAFSHELKTPLTSIIGYSDMLRRKEMSKDQLHLCAEYIFTEGKRLETLSMRLMDLIVLKNEEIHFIPTNIKCFLEDICSVLLPQLKELNIELSCDVNDALIELEPDLMKTVFLNLIDNAKKAISINGQIQINGGWHQNIYIISIHDNGKGMEPQELSKIRDAFYMVDRSRSRQQGGAGLGLAICDEILKLHGFEFHFESTVNIGTTVTLSLKGARND